MKRPAPAGFRKPGDPAAGASANIGGAVRFSRHARNEMRLYWISLQDVEAAVRDPVSGELDERGNARLVGETTDGRLILVVIAGDDPDFVITVFLRS